WPPNEPRRTHRRLTSPVRPSAFFHNVRHIATRLARANRQTPSHCDEYIQRPASLAVHPKIGCSSPPGRLLVQPCKASAFQPDRLGEENLGKRLTRARKLQCVFAGASPDAPAPSRDSAGHPSMVLQTG